MKESRDILTLFEQLNSHEVFTPPRVAREMLALLPKDIWCDPSIRILDPCVKSGVFLREALYLLIDGLAGKGKYVGHDGIEYDLNDGQQRMNHILKNMLFGIATSELTGYISRRTLYGVMEANTDKQTALIDAFEKSKSHKKWTEEEKVRFLVRNHFNEYYDHGLFSTPDYAGFEHEGNIFYPTAEVNKKVDDSDAFIIEDTYYPFIEEQVNHGKIQQIKDGQMKFDVVIGNPPYQVSDGGDKDGERGRGGAVPVYNKFIDSARALKPRFLSMIIPARWYSGGRGLDKFRASMLSSGKISHLVDFPKSTDCFPGVEVKGGICYFLEDKTHIGDCSVTVRLNGKETLSVRPLLEKESSVFIRYNELASIRKKVGALAEKSFSDFVSTQKPFGLRTFFKGHEVGEDGDLVLFRNGGKSYVSESELLSNKHLVGEHKIFITMAYGAGEDFPHQIINKPFYGEPGTCCTETYVLVGPFSSKEESENALSYMKTKFFRAMVLIKKNTQHASKGVYDFVPVVDLKKRWTDEDLYQKYKLDEKEIEFIESMIKPME
ncbi:restriction endonuclease [bacterium]|nr:restriction endonuclease [bacterium]|tara:strand:- start:5252 stop:6898 length:1647 start_codon:yes stop_codon:yes gene_type:complete